MSIEFISGKPGGGKTLMAVEFIVRELLGSERTVVTNVPLNLGALNEYLQTKSKGRVIDLNDRLQILDDAAMRVFFVHRGNGREFGRVLAAGKFIRADYSTAQPGWRPCFYVLDELHLFFNAREWMTTGPAALHYLSQHRKMGDDVLCVTQYTKNVDAQFRALAQEFHQVRNLSKERWGMFAGPPKFKVLSGQMDFSQTTNQEVNIRFFSFNPKLGSLYDTAAGVGLVGAMDADKGKKPKGIPLWWVIPPLVLLGVGMCTLPLWLPKLLMPSVDKIAKNAAPPGQSPVHVVSSPGQTSFVSSPGQALPSVAPGQPVSFNVPPVTVKGWVMSNRGAVVFMSDGSRRFVDGVNLERDGVGRIRFNAVEIDGQLKRIVIPKPSDLVQPVPPVSAPAKTIVVGASPGQPLPVEFDTSGFGSRRISPASDQYGRP